MVKRRVFYEFAQVYTVLAQFGDGGAVAAQIGPAVDPMGDAQERTIIQDDRLDQDAVGPAPMSHASQCMYPDIMDT